MNFCPHCGVKIQFSESKYCHNCGLSLIVAKDVNEPSGINKTVEQSNQKTPAPPTEKEEIDDKEGLEATAYSKGTKFEDTVEAILKAEGYYT